MTNDIVIYEKLALSGYNVIDNDIERNSCTSFCIILTEKGHRFLWGTHRMHQKTFFSSRSKIQHINFRSKISSTEI